MKYRLDYDSEADVLSVLLKEKGELSHAEEIGDLILHVDKKGNPMYLEVLHASKIIPIMVQALAKGHATAQIQ
jgi:uncharacterized protein YuzE